MNHWFRAKDFGWGWTPARWQGWLVLAAWVAINVGMFLHVDGHAHSVSDTLIAFAPLFVISTLLMLVIAWRTGERPTWRWRGHGVQASVVWRKTFQLLLFILIAEAAGIIGTYFTIDAIPTWYAGLAKPMFSPPNWLFGPVWTILYALMGTAAFFVWDERYEKTHASRALGWYWFQLFLNAIWTPVFFGAHGLGFALLVIIALFLSIVMMIREFSKVNGWLAVLLLPYLAWVLFASMLNYSLWMLN